MSAFFLKIFVVHLLALMLPGPDFFFVTRTAMSSSRAAAIAGVLGITAGCCVWAGLSLAGIHLLFEAAPVLENLLMAAGGLYLTWMGAGLLRGLFRKTSAEAEATQLEGSGASDASEASNASDKAADSAHRRERTPFLFGLFTNLANPKAVIYFASVFASFASAGLDPAQKGAVLALVLAETFAWFSLVALVFGMPRLQSGYRRAARAIDGAAGVVFVLFGLGLLRDAAGIVMGF